MGRPFSSEISHLTDTYDWATTWCVKQLTDVIGRCQDMPLIAVGSGGSLSAASYAVNIHDLYSAMPGTVMTPLEFSYRNKTRWNAAVLFLSASGRNPDIVNALKQAALSEPSCLIALCMLQGSKLAAVAERYSVVDLVEFDNPVGKDGFLATNSLFATGLLLYRAYQSLTGGASIGFPRLPKTYRKFVAYAGISANSSSEREERYTRLWQKEHLIVLYGPSTMPAAMDLESKFTEAALGTVQIADYRNFAHGRHHWLAKRNQDSAVLSFASRNEESLAKRTLALLPADTTKVHVQIKENGPLAGISAMNEVLYIVSSAGKAKNIDPGRPGVPLFGRKLYHLSGGKIYASHNGQALPPNEAVAITRKAGRDVLLLAREGCLQEWREAYRSFTRRLNKAQFGALVLDYDGTICGREDRFNGMRPEIVQHLIALLEAGILIGIATGRGDSVREDLRQSFPRCHWGRVIVGYHNGAELAALNETTGAREPEPGPNIQAICDFLKDDFQLRYMVKKFALSEAQISLRVNDGMSLERVYEIAASTLATSKSADLRVQCSGHAVDILAKHATKLSVYQKMVQMLEERRPDNRRVVLCVGDKGRFPGNDFELLSTQFSLSVDQVSSDPLTCWNLAAPGSRGLQAAVAYFHAIRVKKEGVFEINSNACGRMPWRS